MHASRRGYDQDHVLVTCVFIVVYLALKSYAPLVRVQQSLGGRVYDPQLDQRGGGGMQGYIGRLPLPAQHRMSH